MNFCHGCVLQQRVAPLGAAPELPGGPCFAAPPTALWKPSGHRQELPPNWSLSRNGGRIKSVHTRRAKTIRHGISSNGQLCRTPSPQLKVGGVGLQAQNVETPTLGLSEGREASAPCCWNCYHVAASCRLGRGKNLLPRHRSGYMCLVGVWCYNAYTCVCIKLRAGG